MQGNHIDPAFGNWLAGFTDGEGCFQINKGSGYGFFCRFVIRLRQDDLPILDEIYERTRIGTIHREVSAQWAPQARWHVGDQAGCWSLIRIFDAHPLRAKKARDYVIWREAVSEWTRVKSVGRSGRGVARGSVHGPSRDWTRMAQLRDELMASREYRLDECDVVARELVDDPRDAQITLEIT